MRTLTISIDAKTLRRVDELRSQGNPASRSELVRCALNFYADEQERKAWEQKDAALYKKHGKRINAQVRASLQEQASNH